MRAIKKKPTAYFHRSIRKFSVTGRARLHFRFCITHNYKQTNKLTNLVHLRDGISNCCEITCTFPRTLISMLRLSLPVLSYERIFRVCLWTCGLCPQKIVVVGIISSREESVVKTSFC